MGDAIKSPALEIDVVDLYQKRSWSRWTNGGVIYSSRCTEGLDLAAAEDKRRLRLI